MSTAGILEFPSFYFPGHFFCFEGVRDGLISVIALRSYSSWFAAGTAGLAGEM
jgi:hypothetical protein